MCQIESYRLELGQFELIKSDWMMEKESLEGALFKLRQELKSREEKLNAVHVSKVICYVCWFCIICVQIENAF